MHGHRRAAIAAAGFAIAISAACNGAGTDMASSRDASVKHGAAADEIAVARTVGVANAPAAPPQAQLAAQFPSRFVSDSVAPAMVIRSGQASVEVDSLELGIAAVRQLAQRVGGYVANTSEQAGSGPVRTATLELRIPAARFDQALDGLTPIGKVEFVNVTAEDVGEEFVDIQARVANARRLEQRLIELLATRTGKLSDVLQVEQQLARVREEIERMEGRMRYLRTRSAVSTLSLTVHEKFPIVGQHGSLGVIGSSFEQAWRNFIGFVAVLIQSLGVLIPLGAIVAGAWLLVRRYVPRRKLGEAKV